MITLKNVPRYLTYFVLFIRVFLISMLGVQASKKHLLKFTVYTQLSQFMIQDLKHCSVD